jgi:hypothetical protein
VPTRGVPVANYGTLGAETLQHHVFRLETQIAAVAEEDLDEVPDEDLLGAEGPVVLVVRARFPQPLFPVDQQRRTRFPCRRR